MLNDPSVEFRRDAVARLMGEAEHERDFGKPDAARETYRKALSAARSGPGASDRQEAGRDSARRSIWRGILATWSGGD